MSDFKLTPMPGWLIIEPESEKSKSGLYLPPDMGDKAPHGKIIALGEYLSISDYIQTLKIDHKNGGGSDFSSGLSVGDRVFFSKWGGNAIKFEDKTYIFLRYTDLLAVEK